MPGALGPSLTEAVVSEILRDAHRYVPGVQPHRPTLDGARRTGLGRLVHAGHRGRDLVERVAGRAGFTRRHHDPELGAAALLRTISLSDGLERTAQSLGNDASRRALIDVLKMRVLGPYHAPLAITADRYRALQGCVDRTMRRQSATFEVADPWFPSLSRYELPIGGGATIALHAHSIDVVNVFLLRQYRYQCGDQRVVAEPGDVVLDVGGCLGDSALYFASLVGPSGRIYTFEFDPENLEVMRANLALNPELAKRIEIVEEALWDRSGESLEFVPGGRVTALTTERQGSTHTATTITLDDFVQQVGLARLDFVKMDVEGAELRVLAGAREALDRHAPKLAVAAYHRDDDLVLIPDAIAAAGQGYRCFLESFSPLEDETVLFARVPG